jgi:hypothetical protein
MKENLKELLVGQAYVNYRWLFSIAITIFIVAPMLGPEINDFYHVVRGNDREDKIVEESFIRQQYKELRIELTGLNEKIINLTAQVTILTYERRRSKAAFESAPIPIWTLMWNKYSRTATLDEFNPAAEKLILRPENINSDLALGKTWDQLFDKTRAAMYIEDDLKVFDTGKSSVTDKSFTMKEDKTKQYWQTTKWPIYLDGELVGLRGIAIQTESINNK